MYIREREIFIAVQKQPAGEGEHDHGNKRAEKNVVIVVDEEEEAVYGREEENQHVEWHIPQSRSSFLSDQAVYQF